MEKKDEKRIFLEQELERRIVHGLSCEWDHALWVLPEKYREAMKKPLFCIREMKTRLGYWSGEKKEICLSRRMVTEHPWDAVCDVLYHEMAHQLAQQVLGYNTGPTHGHGFQEACYLLRANPKATENYQRLDEKRDNGAGNTSDKIMLRVKKLLALAKSGNRHEAEAAMAKAHELILKYNIDLLAQNKQRDFTSAFIGEPALRHFREEYHLTSLLIDFYFVEGLWVPAYVIKRGKMGRVLEITGIRKNVKIASYVYEFIKRYVDSKWKDYNKTRKLNRYRKTDFSVGIVEGFRFKLEKQKKKVATKLDTYDLIALGDPKLKDYMTYRYPHTRSFSRGGSSMDVNVLNDGKRVGEKMVISKGVTEQKKKRGLLIGHAISG